jgi:hypothetical protein
MHDGSVARNSRHFAHPDEKTQGFAQARRGREDTASRRARARGWARGGGKERRRRDLGACSAAEY